MTSIKEIQEALEGWRKNYADWIPTIGEHATVRADGCRKALAALANAFTDPGEIL